MGIIKAIASADGGGLAGQWLEVIEPDEMSDKTVFTRGVTEEETNQETQTAEEHRILFQTVPSYTFILISL